MTVRAGVARLVERGILERRQGSGTFLARLPEGNGRRSGAMGVKLSSMQTHLGKLETFTMMAERLGLRLSGRDLRIETVDAGPEEAAALEVAEGSGLVKVSRALFVDEKPAAWMEDFVPEETVSAETVGRLFRSDMMLLDLLMAEGIPVGFSEVLIDVTEVAPDGRVGKALGLESPSPALSLTETMYLQAASTDDRPVQWSRDLFLPGTLNLYLVRELLDGRDPSLVFRFPAER